MIKRPTMLMLLLGSSAAIPYAISKASRFWPSSSAESTDRKGSLSELLDGVSGRDLLATELTDEPGSLLYPAHLPLEGLPTVHLEEVFRFDITQNWVYARWPRKSTALAEENLFGIRVPLVTGNAVDDLAGSLTYYFNASGQVQHITFRGRTGDARRIVGVVASRFGLGPQSSSVPGEQLYQSLWNGRPQSELRARPAAVLWSSSPHSSIEVALDLERPGSNRFLR